MADDPMAHDAWTDDLLIPIEADTPVPLEEVLAASGLARQEVVELIEIGVFQLAGTSPVWTFRASTISLARRACRLRDAFGLNVAGIALALTYLERIERLERRLRELESQLPGSETPQEDIQVRASA